LAAEDAAAYLFLSLLQARVGGSLAARLGDRPARTLLEEQPVEISRQLGLTERVSRAFAELREGFDPAETLSLLDREDVRLVTLADGAYPTRLRGAPDPPPALFVRGRIPDGTRVAVVGSRGATPGALETAHDIGRTLVAGGAVVVSGLAAGVDAAAHEGALAGAGETVGVLGCGIDVVYPRSNRRLFGRVAASGGLVSEYFLGEAPLAWRFPARNRIIAGLSDVVVVVEAPEKSGALITARHALDAGRDVWAVPGPVAALECRGSNRLLADGAGVLWDIEEFVRSVTDGSDLAPLDPSSHPRAQIPKEPSGLPEQEAAVLRGVDFRSVAADVVAGRTGVEMRAVLSSLAMLELKGHVARDASGNFARRVAP
jgi:DNA processing protein